MHTVAAGNLAPKAREADVHELFSQYGTVRSRRLIADIFTGKCRGIGFVQMEGHEARAAMAALNGKTFKDRPLKVNPEQPRERRGSHRSRH